VRRLKVVALAGGTGSSKLLRGLAKAGVQLTVVCNVGDNYRVHGLYVCPDVDIAMYTLAGVADRSRGWGIEGDTFETLAQLRRLGAETWFMLGDRDIATHIFRTAAVESGATLTEVTARLASKLGVSAALLPATDDPEETMVLTPGGVLHLQEFWVRERGKPRALGVEYRGADSAEPTAEVKEALETADRIVFCPGNPVTSIGPILGIAGMRSAMSRANARKVALSPMVGRGAFSGPAAKLMRATGTRPDSAGVARLYSGVVDALLIDSRDASLSPLVEREGVVCVLTDAVMDSPADETRLAKEMLSA
jgi:LPPG:FO 2-phospho-L-lactate transferase